MNWTQNVPVCESYTINQVPEFKDKPYSEAFTCLCVFVQVHNLPLVYPALVLTIRPVSLKTLSFKVTRATPWQNVKKLCLRYTIIKRGQMHSAALINDNYPHLTLQD